MNKQIGTSINTTYNSLESDLATIGVVGGVGLLVGVFMILIFKWVGWLD